MHECTVEAFCPIRNNEYLAAVPRSKCSRTRQRTCISNKVLLPVLASNVEIKTEMTGIIEKGLPLWVLFERSEPLSIAPHSTTCFAIRRQSSSTNLRTRRSTRACSCEIASLVLGDYLDTSATGVQLEHRT